MSFTSHLDSVAFRFSFYIKELDDFFTQQGVRFGQPSDLPPFAKLLESSPSFHDDVGSLIRSILYREAEKVSPGELFEVLILAVGGQKVEDASEDFHEPVSRIFAFVNEALRDRRNFASSASASDARPAAEQRSRRRDSEPADDPRSASAHLAVASGAPGGESHGLAGTNGDRTERGFVPKSLFGAYGPPANRVSDDDGYHDEAPRRRAWVVPVSIAALVLGSVALYVAGPRFLNLHPADGQPDSSSTRAGNAAPLAAPGKGVSACFGSSPAPVSSSSLAQAFQQVRDLRSHKRFDDALVGMRDIAAVDPGFPGINLEISDLTLQLGQRQQARDAVSSQIAISDCLAALPAQTLDGYCRAEFPTDSVDTCHARVAQTRAAAQMQATVVTEQLSRNLGEAPARPSPKPAHTVARAARAPVRPLSLDDEAAPSRPARSRTPSRDPSLVEGQGTDSALGAYSKPQ